MGREERLSGRNVLRQEGCVTTIKLYLGLRWTFRIHTATQSPARVNVCGLTFFLHLYFLMFVTYDNVTD